MKIEPREIVAYATILMFAFALVSNPTDQMLLGALIGAFTTALTFYLGNSKRDQKIVPQPVTVENGPNDPVPVKGGE